MLGGRVAKSQKEIEEHHRGKKAVFDTFSRLRHAEEARRLENVRITAERKERWRSAQKVIAEKNAAAIKLQAKRRQLLQLENVAACKHAVRNFTLDELGKGAKNAGGKQGKKNRLDVLDRLARINAGFSAGQKNDWAWFKGAWDKAMLMEHGAAWLELFAT